MIAITGGKGGCGKTTTTLGLARAFARRGQDPLVVDGDSDMPDLHHLAGVSRTPGVDALADGASLETVVHRAEAAGGAAVVPAGRRRHLGRALRAVRRWHGPVLVDCAAGATHDALLPLRQADTSLVVTTDRRQCLADANQTADAARRLGARPAGLIVRDTDSAFPLEESTGERILARVPSVDQPLEHPPVRQHLVSISKMITRAAGEGTSSTSSMYRS